MSDTPAIPDLNDVLRWLGGEAGHWRGRPDDEQNVGQLRYYQTNVISRRLMDWRDTGREPAHGLD